MAGEKQQQTGRTFVAIRNVMPASAGTHASLCKFDAAGSRPTPDPEAAPKGLRCISPEPELIENFIPRNGATSATRL